jgi:hypothetical protein
MRTLRVTGNTIALIGIVSISPAALADGPQAVATAAQHAGLAAAAGDIAGAHRHLHHALNCLIGPDGEGFDEAAGNPCRDAGGAIPQTADAQMKENLEDAAMKVRDAIENDDPAAVKEVAMSVQDTLE